MITKPRSRLGVLTGATIIVALTLWAAFPRIDQAASGDCMVIDGQRDKTYNHLNLGPCVGEGLVIKNSVGITITDVRVHDAVTNIHIFNSSAITIDGGELTNPKGPFPRGQQVLVENSRNVVVRNLVTNFSSGFQEDAINAFHSDYVLIEHNSITGGTSPTGCGVVVDEASNFITIRGNIIRHQANCGIGIAGGVGNVVEHNDIADYGFEPGLGKVAIYVWNQYAPLCRNVRVVSNSADGNNPYWDGGNCTTINVEDNSWQ